MLGALAGAGVALALQVLFLPRNHRAHDSVQGAIMAVSSGAGGGRETLSLATQSGTLFIISRAP